MAEEPLLGGCELDKERASIESSKVLSGLSRLDLFSYLPVPHSQRISTRKSILGSVLLLSLFLAYVSATFYSFFTNNPPKVNNILVPLGDHV